VELMLKDLTRARVILLWFAIVAVVIAGGVAFGASVTVGTGAMLLALCLAPPVIVLLMWPRVQPRTVAEVLHDVEQRG
jgi:hypothetical protein